jgi:hypothetical protein
MPVEGADPTFYNTSEQPNVTGTAVTTSKAATAKVTLSAAKFSASVYLSGELDDDAKIAGGIQPYVQAKLGNAFAELIDKALINGDTATGANVNVNLIDGTPTAGTYYLGFDGLVAKVFAGSSMTYDAGTPIHVAPDFALGDSSGKIPAAGGTLGRFLIVYMPELIFGWRRKMKITVRYLEEYDQYRITAHTRFTATMATANKVAMGLNITV